MYDSSRHLPNIPPRWHHYRTRRLYGLPAYLADWLFNSGSLTRRLRLACTNPGTFRVQVLRQGWNRPGRDETQVLQLQSGVWVWVREVQILGNDRAWVFARTLIPAATLRGRGQRLTQLGARPLGEVLFTDPGVHREPVEIARILPGQRLHQSAFAGLNEPSDAIWGRRSIFRIDGNPLLVCELFLPDLPAFAPGTHSD